MKFVLAFLIGLMALALTACSNSLTEDASRSEEQFSIVPTTSIELSCVDQAMLFLESSRDITLRWIDARGNAEFSLPQSLEGPIKVLKALRTEWSGIETPTCTTYVKLGEAKAAMNEHMALVIEGYSLRMNGESISIVDAKFDEASVRMDNYVKIMEEVLK